MALLELYIIETEEQFKAAGPVLTDGYEKPFNSFWELLRGPSQDEGLNRLWQWHSMTPGSRWIGVRKKGGDTVGLANWILHESNPFANGNPIPPAYWWSDVYLKDITEQVCNIFFGRRPKYMSRPHLLLNICCVAQNSRRQGGGKLLMDFGRNLADQKGVDTFIEATVDGVRLYESSGFAQIEPIFLDARLPEQFEGEADKKAWLTVRNRVLPSTFPTVLMWRPIGADWKRGDELQPSVVQDS